MLYHEITASSLVKVDMQGSIVEKGTTNYGVNKESFQLHSAIHAARPDIKCIIHIHTNSVLAVSIFQFFIYSTALYCIHCHFITFNFVILGVFTQMWSAASLPRIFGDWGGEHTSVPRRSL